MSDIRRADVCAVACAELFRGDGERLGHPIGTMPTIGARLARATFEPRLVLTDGESYTVAGVLPLGAPAGQADAVESWLPYRKVFDLCFAGRRHVVMGASQIDRHGNQNIACIGEWPQPKVQLIGVRGAPGNTINHPTSYWVPKHTSRVFVEKVDFVSGVGIERARAVGVAGRFAELRGIVTDLCVLGFDDQGRPVLRSVHPGVTAEEVLAGTGFEIQVPADVSETRNPTDEDLELLERIDPDGARFAEVAA